MPSEAERLRVALKSLRNEVSGLLGYAETPLRGIIGHTNVAVLKVKLQEADDALAATPSPASLDEAVRVVDEMTCSRCRSNVPREATTHSILIHRYDSKDDRDCTAHGREIIDALVSKGLLK